MARRKAIAFSLGCLLIAAATLGGYAYYAMREVRPFYAQAIEAPPRQLEAAAERMEARVEELVSDPKPPGPWETIFTDEEVNGWLATIVRDRYSDLLPPEVSEPRVAFRRDRCMIGYQYQGKTFRTVISIEGTASMPADDQVAVRLRQAYAGVLPLPMSRVVREVSLGAEKLGIPITWTEDDDDPVLHVSVAGALSTDEERREVQRIELREGELVLAGTAEPQSPAQDEVAMLNATPQERQTVQH